MASTQKTRLAIYTVLIGDKEILNDPLHRLGSDAGTDLQLDFFCFTDNRKLRSPVWQFRDFKQALVPHEKASRRPKALPQRYFPEYEYSLYIDNTVVFKRLPNSVDLEGAPFKAFRHPWRSSPVDEADIVVKYALDTPDVVAEQMHFYAGIRSLDQIKTLTAGTVLLRRHHDPRVRAFGETWWEQILLFSKRDQLSLDLSAEEVGCPIEYFPGDKRNNDLFLWPVLPGNARRVLGSFDVDLYAWNNRRDPEARANPRAHFLQHDADAAQYDRRVSVFRYACGKVGSSLGSLSPPRRNITEPVQFMLDGAAAVDSILIVGVASDEIYSVDQEELVSAAAAFKQYHRFGPEPKLFSSLIPLANIMEPEPFVKADHQNVFGLILVLGLSPGCYLNALAKFSPILAVDGQVLIQFGDSLTEDQLQEMHATISYRGKMSVFHGGHIASKTAIPSSVVLLNLRQDEVNLRQDHAVQLAVNS